MKLSGWKNILRITYRRLKVGFSVCWLSLLVTERVLIRDWMKCTSCNRLLLVKNFYLTCFFFFSSLENYFGFRITKGKGKMDHSVSQRRNKKFWTFPKGQVFFWLCIRIICKWILCAAFHLNSFTGLNYNPLVFSYK